jgi:glycosyltransferase involved in cell wall biosynthesis
MKNNPGNSELNFDQFVEKYQKIPVKEYPNCVIESLPYPEITVRVITYQHEPYIGECLESILRQETDIPFEIIIGEDQSTDGTREICIDYAKRYPDKIRLFLNHRENNIKVDGKATARFNSMFLNFMSRGDFVMSVDGDDYWIDSKKIQFQYERMINNPKCHLSFHPVISQEYGNNSASTIFKQHKDSDYVFNTKELIQRGGDFCPTVSLMIKRDSLLLQEWVLQVPTGDVYAQIFASIHGGALYINRVMAVYRRNVPGSWSSRQKSFIIKCRHYLTICKTNRIFNNILNHRYKNEFKEREDRIFRNHATFNTFKHDRETIREVFSAIEEITSGQLKVKSYFYVLLSFLFFKCNLNKVYYYFKKPKNN